LIRDPDIKTNYSELFKVVHKMIVE